MPRWNFRFSPPLVGWVLSCVLLVGALLGATPFRQTALAATAAGSGAWTWPVDGKLLTPFRNGDDPYAAGQHRGVDIAAPVGTPVRATTGGNVNYAGHLPDSGVCVTVRSADGRYLVSYLHLSSLAVKRGDSIATGSVVGLSGTTGKRSVEAPHLHLSVRLAAGGAYVDPLPLLGPRTAVPIGTEESNGAASPLSAAPPAAGENGARNGTQRAQGKELPDARERARTLADTRGRNRRNHAQRNQTQRRQTQHRQTSVHAHSNGDSVAGTRSKTAGDSARESHVPRGRVAPPPLHTSRTTLTTDSPNTENSDSHELLSSQPDSENSSPDHASRRYLMFAAVAALLALAMFLPRRRAGTAGEPADGEPEIVIARQDAAAPDRVQPPRPHLYAVER